MNVINTQAKSSSKKISANWESNSLSYRKIGILFTCFITAFLWNGQVLGQCTQTATCNLSDINEVACTIPVAFTDPNDVFSGIESCSEVVTMTNADVGDTDMCGDGDGADFTRTYSLLFD